MKMPVERVWVDGDRLENGARGDQTNVESGKDWIIRIVITIPLKFTTKVL